MAAWSPRFSALLAEEVAAAGSSEPPLGEVFARALAVGLRVEAVWFPGGRFHDLGTPAGLGSLLLPPAGTRRPTAPDEP